MFYDLGTVFIFMSIFIFTYWWVNKPKNLPPGPLGLPIIGNILDFRKKEEIPRHFTDLAKKYGKIYTLALGTQYFIIVSGYDAIKETCVSRGAEVVDRSIEAPLLKEFSQGKGILFANGSEWKEQRRFALHILRDLGLGKVVIEERIEEEARILNASFEDLSGELFNPADLLQNAVANVICSIVVGHRFEPDDEKFLKVLRFVKAMTQEFNPMALSKFPHLLKYVGMQSAEIILRSNEELMSFLKQEIEEHEAVFDPNCIRDYIDSYLNEKQKSETASELGSSGEFSLMMSVRDLFIAGAETTANTLSWSLLYMIVYPDIQKHVQDELDSVVGRDRMPTVSDVNQCQYVQATMNEILRFACIVNLTPPHSPTDKHPLELMGYDIPGDAIILGNLYSVMRDPQLWKKVDTFYPENFLDENGQFYKPDWFIPFGIGPRICLGEKLAKTEFQIFFPYLLHQFCFEKVEGNTYSTDNAGSFVSITFPYEVKAIKRN